MVLQEKGNYLVYSSYTKQWTVDAEEMSDAKWRIQIGSSPTYLIFGST